MGAGWGGEDPMETDQVQMLRGTVTGSISAGVGQGRRGPGRDWVGG